MAKGLFITLEGTDGVGKSTQCALLIAYFEQKNKDAISIREPGSTKIGEQIRQILKDKSNDNISFFTESYLYAAARAQLVEEIIKPALTQNKIVICDRFLDSSLVYQGVARGLGIDTVEKINAHALQNIKPNITFFLDVDPNISLDRIGAEKELDRIEMEGINFQKKVYDGYISLSKSKGKDFCVLDGTKTPEEVHKQLVQTLLNKELI